MEQNNNNESEIPVRKIFISYSRSNDEYVNKVRELAEELANHTMDVELDQWSLKEGDDKSVYMERMVNDPTIDKVIILLDKKYKEKADDREGGVGTEATILTPKVYADVVEKRGRQKFIPVIMERDPETKKEFVPTFLDGRIYIDLTDANHYAEKFEELVRAIHDKPIHKKPLPGKAPSYLLENEGINLGTSSRARRAIEFLVNDKSQALNAVKDYFAIVIENLKILNFPEETKEIQTTEVIEKLQETLPLRDEIIDVISSISKYRDDSAFYEEIHNFFEQVIPYFDYRNNNNPNLEWAADHYKFLGYELFLYAVALFLKFQRFEQLNELTGQGYYFVGSPYDSNRSSLMTFCYFDTHSDALRTHSQRQRQWRDDTIEAKFIQQRAVRKDIKFEDLTQADFILYLLYNMDKKENSWGYSWFPKMLTISYQNTPFEMFLRSQSQRFFDKFRVGLRNSSKDDLKGLIEKIKKSDDDATTSSRLNVAGLLVLIGIEQIATKP